VVNRHAIGSTARSANKDGDKRLIDIRIAAGDQGWASIHNKRRYVVAATDWRNRIAAGCRSAGAAASAAVAAASTTQDEQQR
jgi:hypothetical protein